MRATLRRVRRCFGCTPFVKKPAKLSPTWATRDIRRPRGPRLLDVVRRRGPIRRFRACRRLDRSADRSARRILLSICQDGRRGVYGKILRHRHPMEHAARPQALRHDSTGRISRHHIAERRTLSCRSRRCAQALRRAQRRPLPARRQAGRSELRHEVRC